MKVIAVVSAKGGVGKSTVSANLAVALKQAGWNVFVVDMDPQNAMVTHFNLAAYAQHGIADAVFSKASWKGFAHESPSGVHVIPFGLVDEEHRIALEQRLHDSPDLLGQRLREVTGSAENAVVIVDTPPGPSAYLQQALMAADLAVVVSLADAGSYSTIPIILNLIETYGRENTLEYGLILNQVDRAYLLHKDVSTFVLAKFGDLVIGVIHQDQAVAESLAFQQSVLDYSPHAMASLEFIQCAERVGAMLSSDVISDREYNSRRLRA
jgi:cellulose synthase operon protein YhjQ